ncbi:MAG: hypothetical protein ACXVBE_11580 [Bdellovibrionota bacterium]
MDTRIAREVFGHEVWATNKTLHEKTPDGKRPLRNYTKEIEWAWEVAQHMRISVMPVNEDQWFAFVAGNNGWKSPQEFAEFLQAGNFKGCGAAVGENIPAVICEAALRALDKNVMEIAESEHPTQ